MTPDFPSWDYAGFERWIVHSSDGSVVVLRFSENEVDRLIDRSYPLGMWRSLDRADTYPGAERPCAYCGGKNVMCWWCDGRGDCA